MPLPLPLSSIKVLWRQPDLLALWGIPYEMRTDVGQSPRDIWQDAQRHTGVEPKGWVWLGQPGWWGTLAKGSPERAEVEAFLASLPKDAIPANPGEWSRLGEWGMRTCGCGAAFAEQNAVGMSCSSACEAIAQGVS